MMDHYPSPYEVSMAQQNFDMGHPTCADIEVLNFVYPWANYSGCDCVGEFFEAVFNPTGFPW